MSFPIGDAASAPSRKQADTLKYILSDEVLGRNATKEGPEPILKKDLHILGKPKAEFFHTGGVNSMCSLRCMFMCDRHESSLTCLP